MLAITLLVPNPRVTGFSTGGPPLSTHMILRRPAWSSQLTASRPDSPDRAPYFAELVTSSCSASAMVWAVAGSSWISGPRNAIWSPVARRASSSSVSVLFSAPGQLDSVSPVCPRASAWIRPSSEGR